MIDIGLAGAFLGGLFALVSPCSALLLPSFFAYAFDGWGRLMGRTALFYLGLALVLVPLGAGVGAMGSLVTQYRGTVTTIGGVLLIVFGLLAITGRGFSFIPGGRSGKAVGGGGGFSVLALGAVYGFAGFCSGPLLGAVLTFAIAGGDPVYGGMLMAVYALGMALPLFALALVWNNLELGRRRWLRGKELVIGPLRTHTTSLVSGLVFVGIGLLFILTEGTANLGGIVAVERQFALQEWGSNLAKRVPDFVVPLLVVAVVLLATWRAAVAPRRGEAAGPGRNPSEGELPD